MQTNNNMQIIYKFITLSIMLKSQSAIKQEKYCLRQIAKKSLIFFINQMFE